MARGFDACTCWTGSIGGGPSRLDQDDQPEGSADPGRDWDEWSQLWAAGQFAQGETPCKLSAMPPPPVDLTLYLLDSMPFRGGRSKGWDGAR
jgi:hypothetical protein